MYRAKTSIWEGVKGGNTTSSRLRSFTRGARRIVWRGEGGFQKKSQGRGDKQTNPLKGGTFAVKRYAGGVCGVGVVPIPKEFGGSVSRHEWGKRVLPAASAVCGRGGGAGARGWEEEALQALVKTPAPKRASNGCKLALPQLGLRW